MENRLEDFIAKSILRYVDLPISAQSLARKMRMAGGTKFESHTVAGAYIQLPHCKALRVRGLRKEILSGLWARVNESHVIAVMLYVEGGQLSTVELAAPVDDMPRVIHVFHFEHAPSEKIKN